MTPRSSFLVLGSSFLVAGTEACVFTFSPAMNQERKTMNEER